MPGCPIPDNDRLAVGVRMPLGQLLQESDGLVTVTRLLMPDQALTMGKVIGTIPIKPILERGAMTGHPIRFAPD